MKNKSKIGNEFENILKRWLEIKYDMTVIRSAGSKSPIDLVALDFLGTMLFQCKSTKNIGKSKQVVQYGKTYRDFENISVSNSNVAKYLAFYNFATEKVIIFYLQHDNVWKKIAEHIIPKNFGLQEN